MASKHILVVDDEIGIRELLSDILHDEGHHVSLAHNAQTARELRAKQRPDLVLLDIWMPDCDGVSLLKEWGNAGLLTMPVVMMSGHATIDTAVEATRIGAFDFLEKPIALQKLLKTVEAALKHAEKLPKMEMNVASLGKSQVIADLKQRLEQISRTKAPLLLIGHAGGSVESCARFLHIANTPWLALKQYDKVATAPLDLLAQNKEGVIYIHEISALDKTEQKGLALMLGKADKFDVRVICASQLSLQKLAEPGVLELQLLQMLSHGSLKIPSLNDHKEDVPDLADALATIKAERANLTYKPFDVAALNALRNADWSGDLTQLEAVVHNLLLTSLGDKITLADVMRVLEQFATQPDSAAISQALNLDLNQPLRETREDFERFYFQHHMKQVNSNMSRLAELSGLERTHLYRKLKQLGIKIKG